MPKEWILNMATNRWGLNKKDRVGPVSLWIREIAPKTPEDWERYYMRRLRKFLREKGIPLKPQSYLESLGQKLYTKISEVIQAEIDEISEQDCIEYIRNLLIHRTFDGYQTEVNTVHGKLQKLLGIPLHPAPDLWDRRYHVDFYIQINQKFIGIQIKPVTYDQTPEIHKWREWLGKTHHRFTREKGGKVFTVFSIKRNGQKEIWNQEVIEEIQEEIQRLARL